MIDPRPAADQQIETPPHEKRGRGKFYFAVILFLMVLFLIAGGNLMQRQMRNLDEEVGNDRARIKALEEHVRDMQERPQNAPAASSGSAQPPLDVENQTPDVARLQSDLAALSSALSALQGEVKATGTVASQTRETAQTSVASLLAFVQLRESVLSGRKFGDELAAMKTAAKDSGLKDALSKLDAYAGTGVATPATLSDQLIPLETVALQAVDKADAQDWQDRFMAELKGLISIRPLHGAAGSGFTAMENSLAAGDTAAALTALNNLPPEAQHVLEDWRTRAQARTAAEQALRDVSLLVSAQGAP